MLRCNNRDLFHEHPTRRKNNNKGVIYGNRFAIKRIYGRKTNGNKILLNDENVLRRAKKGKSSNAGAPSGCGGLRMHAEFAGFFYRSSRRFYRAGPGFMESGCHS
jgi:hypothetical protein